jgi:hypothetical protein
MDILHLARTSLNIRAILMSRDSAHIWATARSVVGMPECPPDLSEPQYASLMFERTCFVSCHAQLLMEFSPTIFRHVVAPVR